MAYKTVGGKLVKVGKKGYLRGLLNSAPEPRLSSRDIEPKPLRADKGVRGGACNITACQRPDSAYWFNHSTRKWYCGDCAHELNRVNRDAWDIYGHDLCTLWEGGYDCKVKELGMFDWSQRYDTAEDAFAATMEIFQHNLAKFVDEEHPSPLDDFGYPDVQVVACGPRWAKVTIDMAQPVLAELEAFVEAGEDVEDLPMFDVTYQVHLDPRYLRHVGDGWYVVAAARCNGGDYGAITFVSFNGRESDTEESIIPIYVNDALREQVLAGTPITFTARFSVCAFT